MPYCINLACSIMTSLSRIWADKRVFIVKMVGIYTMCLSHQCYCMSWRHGAYLSQIESIEAAHHKCMRQCSRSIGIITSLTKKSHSALVRTLSHISCPHNVPPSLGMLPIWANLPRHIWLFVVTSTHHLANFQIVHGVATWAAWVMLIEVVRSVMGQSLQHTHRSVEECYSPWPSWWSSAMALAGCVTQMTMVISTDCITA